MTTKKVIIFTTKQRSSAMSNFTKWRLALYEVKRNKPVFLKEIKTQYSSHKQNILEHLRATRHPRLNRDRIREKYDIIQLEK